MHKKKLRFFKTLVILHKFLSFIIFDNVLYYRSYCNFCHPYTQVHYGRYQFFLPLSFLTSIFLLCVLFSEHSFLIICPKIFDFSCQIPIIDHVYCVSYSVSYRCRWLLSLEKLLIYLMDDRQRVQSDYTTIYIKEINILLFVVVLTTFQPL